MSMKKSKQKFKIFSVNWHTKNCYIAKFVRNSKNRLEEMCKFRKDERLNPNIIERNSNVSPRQLKDKNNKYKHRNDWNEKLTVGMIKNNICSFKEYS